MFNQEIMENRKNQSIVTIVMSAALVCALSFMIRSVISTMWIEKKDSVACIPTQVDAPQPMVYFQSGYHPVQEDSKLKKFMLDYVKLTKTESYINQHKISKSGRYDELMLSKYLLAAIDLSVGAEKIRNQKRFDESSLRLKKLKEDKVSIEFLVKSYSYQGLLGSGSARVSIRGQYQIIFDGAQVDMPTRYLGEHEITYIISVAESIDDSDKRARNEYGFYVIDSFEIGIQPLQSTMLDQRSRESFLINN